jgi:GT2 family glycosyltransferase
MSMQDRNAPLAVLMTLYRSDKLAEFEMAMQSLEAQQDVAPPRIYLCVDGPVPQTHEDYLAANAGRFYKVVRNPVNIGLGRSLNNLIEVLEDELYVFRMDGDDLCDPRRFIVQATYMDAHPDVALCGCQANDIDADGNVRAARSFPTEPAVVARALGRLTPVLHPTFCLRRSVLHDPRIRYTDAHLCEDTGFLVTLYLAGYSCANVPETLFSWRIPHSFFERRADRKRGWQEMKWYSRVVRHQKGLFTLAYVYPFSRFALRCVPIWLAKAIYRSPVRKWVMGG